MCHVWVNVWCRLFISQLLARIFLSCLFINHPVTFMPVFIWSYISFHFMSLAFILSNLFGLSLARVILGYERACNIGATNRRFIYSIRHPCNFDIIFNSRCLTILIINFKRYCWISVSGFWWYPHLIFRLINYVYWDNIWFNIYWISPNLFLWIGDSLLNSRIRVTTLIFRIRRFL